ncbi:MAG: hypothetical protein J6R32_00280 [Bacteroidales bacterium]|nr:hypothetical protein [Bacteroidales bacterium]
MARYTINVDDEFKVRYEEIVKERQELQKSINERLTKYKGNMKRLSKDMFYKEDSYKFVMLGIELNDIKDKIFKQVVVKWTKTKKES